MSQVAPAPSQPFDPETFDPWSQNVTMYAPDGSSVVVSMENVNTYRLYTARVSTSFGSQTGASVVLLLVLLLLTKREKRKSSIFILNCLCLVLNSLRCIFLVCYVTGGFMHPYTLLTGVGRYSIYDVVVSVMGTTLTTMVTTCIMASLSLQTWVACITTSKLQRVLIMSITTTMALISVGTKFAYMVAANISVVQLSMRDTDKLSALSYITQAVTILLYSFVFVWKLGYAVVQRRRLKMQQFGPMQIVFIMGCQTLIIPALFTAASFLRPVTDKIPEVGTLVITILCVFLPLSAIWAGVANDSAIAYRGPDAHHHLINSQFGRNGAGTVTSSTTAFDKSRQMSCSTCSYVKKTEDFDLSEYSPAGRGGITEDDGIHVDHEYTVHHETIPLERV